MAEILFKLEANGSPSLNGYGNIYRAPIRSTDPALCKNVKVRISRSSEPISLKPGIYIYWFQVQNGEGKFTVKAYRKGVEVPFAEQPFDTATDRFHRLQFKFQVTL